MMGCGASQSPIIPQVTQPSINREGSIKSKENSIKSSTMAKAATSSSSTATNILISCHSESEKIAETLTKSFRQTAEYTCHVITEKSPQSLSSRANHIRWSDIFIVLINRAYQRTPFCMETINYAKDVSKLVVAILVQPTFQPYGALGAIAASAAGSFIWNENIFEQLKVNIATQTIKKKGPANISLNDTNNSELILVRGQSQCQILICATNDGATVGQMIHRELLKHKHQAVFENLSQPTARCSIEHCSVFVPILSPEYELSSMCRAASEEARRTSKPIVPVIAIAKWRPEEWLGLTIAGLTFFRIFDEESAYKPFFDSNRITDLRVAIEIAMTPVPTTEERERIEMKVLKEKIEECKKQLNAWPPARQARNTGNPLADRKAVRVKLEEPKAKLRFVHIHHSITRMDMKAPSPLLDEYGLPKRREIDCMISYQWDDQKLVRKVYEDMTMREMRAWFDIWGSMQGSTNDAMATGVECAKVMLVFLSKPYVKSKNCLLEFRYAVKRGKPFVILRTEPNIPMEQWMIESIEGFPQYDVFQYNTLEELINNVPLIDVIMQAIRALAQAQPRDIVDDCSVELLELRMLLDDARDALSTQTGQQRYKTCTRCGQQFDEYTKGGCHKHRAYYLGGTIIEGRWVCCRQQQRDSVGCEPCDHIDQKRVFIKDPSYGTWTWEPS